MRWMGRRQSRVEPLQRAIGSRSRVALAMALAVAAAMALPASAAAIADGHVSGKVTAQSGGKEIPDLEVCVEPTKGSGDYCHATNTKGEYDIEVPEGSYYVAFYPESCPEFEECTALDYLAQYYKDKPHYEEAEALMVKSGETRSGINAAMATAATLEGQVTAAVGGAELAGVRVCAYSDESEYVYRCTYTEEEGFYEIVGLPTEKYVVGFFGGTQCPPGGECVHLNYVSQYYNGKRYDEATLVQLVAGSETVGIGAKLKQGAKIEGVVTAAAGGAPVSDAGVCPRNLSSAAEAECTNTNSKGEYTLEGLEGEYGIAFYGNGSTLGPELYENATSTADEKHVDAVPPGTTTGIDAHLPTSGQIAGVVTAAPSGSPVEGVDVCAHSEAGFNECTYTNSAGEYTIKGVVGLYTVEFYGDESCLPECSPLPYVNQYYHGVYNPERAETIVVEPGAKVTGIDARLAASVKQGEEETEARKLAEAVAKAAEAAAKKHEEEVAAAAAAAKRHAEEEAIATAAAVKKHEEELAAARRREEAAASVKLEKVKVTAKDLVLTIKTSEKGTVTITGPGLKKTVETLGAGTHVVKVPLTKTGKADRAHGKKIKLTLSLKVDARTVSSSKAIKL